MTNVRLADIVRGARSRSVSLAGEIAGYLTLAMADQLMLAPREIDPESVELDDRGAIRVASGVATDEAGAERSLRSALELLLGAASGPSPSLLRVARREPTGSVKKLVSELEAALIPVNRAAARRALCRLERETAMYVSRAPSREPVVLPASASTPYVEVRRAVVASPAPQVPEVVTVAAVAPAPATEPVQEPRVAPTNVEPDVELDIDVEIVDELDQGPFTPAEPVIRRARMAARPSLSVEALPVEALPVDDLPGQAALGEAAGSGTPFLGSLAWLAGVVPFAPSNGPQTAIAPTDEALTDRAPLCAVEGDEMPGEAALPEAELSWGESSIAREEAALMADSSHENIPQPSSEPPAESAPSYAVTAKKPVRKSDVSELIKAFRLERERTDREIAKDLRALAGLDTTPAPPGISQTPPPVVAENVSFDPAPQSVGPIVPRATLAIGAGALALAMFTLLRPGASSTAATSDFGTVRPAVAAAPGPVAAVPTARPRDCVASVRVEHVQARSTLLLRELSGQEPVRRASGTAADFDGLTCGRDYELVIADEKGAWRRVPVPRQKLQPVPGETALPRVVVDAR